MFSTKNKLRLAALVLLSLPLMANGMDYAPEKLSTILGRNGEVIELWMQNTTSPRLEFEIFATHEGSKLGSIEITKDSKNPLTFHIRPIEYQNLDIYVELIEALYYASLFQTGQDTPPIFCIKNESNLIKPLAMADVGTLLKPFKSSYLNIKLHTKFHPVLSLQQKLSQIPITIRELIKIATRDKTIEGQRQLDICTLTLNQYFGKLEAEFLAIKQKYGCANNLIHNQEILNLLESCQTQIEECSEAMLKLNIAFAKLSVKKFKPTVLILDGVEQP